MVNPALSDEWHATLYKDPAGEVTVSLYEVVADGQLSFIDSERFGPFETALDVTQWLTRHWAPRARLRLR